MVVRWLIDGYNVMHAGGRLGPKVETKSGRERFRRARRRFLDDLAATLGSEGEPEITVVFDATMPPGDFPLRSTYHGIRVVFALDDENADARIELLIAEETNPKSLTVVSSDRRIRQAANRRKCQSMTAEKFWEHLDALQERALRKKRLERHASSRTAPSIVGGDKSPDESAFWLETFRAAVESPEVQKALAPNTILLTDAEIAELSARSSANGERGHATPYFVWTQVGNLGRGRVPSALTGNHAGTVVKPIVTGPFLALGVGKAFQLKVQDRERNEGPRISGERAAEEGRSRRSGGDRRHDARGGRPRLTMRWAAA